jgi:hypothetical protein
MQPQQGFEALTVMHATFNRVKTDRYRPNPFLNI